MASEIYSELQGIAQDVLTEFSQGSITYRHLTPGTGPADNPGPSVKTPYSFEGVMRGVKQKYVDGSTIVVTDLQTTAPGGIGIEPNIKGEIVADGLTYKIIKIDRKPAIGIPVAFTFIVRK